MMNMKILSVVTPQSIYNGYPTWKKFWKEKFTGEEKFTLGEFTDANMNNCGLQNVRKYREIKGSDKYVTLDIYLKFDSMEKISITSSYPKHNFGNIRKVVDYLSEYQGQNRAKEIQKGKVCHRKCH